MSSGAVAALDLGTNSTRLLVADARGVALERLMRITRLGQGVDETGRLADEAVQRTLGVLGEFRKVMDGFGVVRARATATSAARDAANAGEFAERVTDVLGLVPEVLDGKEEARLSYEGATCELDQAQGPYLVIDVGGGSTELVGGRPPGLHAVSLEMGCVRVTERFLKDDPPREDELAAARAHVHRLVAGALEDEPDLKGARRLVGLAGTVSALSRLDQGLVGYDRSRIHHSKLSLEVIERLLGELSAMTVSQRLQLSALEAERADVIVGGALVLAEAVEVLGFGDLTVSESDLLDGVVAELLGR